MIRHFTSESVTAGHPDKVADRISDSVLDAILAEDPEARVACETLVTPQKVIVAGETTNRSSLTSNDLLGVVRRAIADIGYTYDDVDFHAEKVAVEVLLGRQSADIACGVSKAAEARQGSIHEFDQLGAGDQGMMFGYANRDTEELMPAPIQLAHQLAARLTKVRVDGVLDYLRPDGKTQVTVTYEKSKPVRVERVLISTHHAAYVDDEKMRAELREHVMMGIGSPLIDSQTELLVNPSGRFVKGGPEADAGLTGRKIIVDTYGGFARHGGIRSSRWRGPLGQGPHQGRSFGRLLRPLRGQKRGGGRFGGKMRDPGGLRHRPGPPLLGVCGCVRDRKYRYY